MNDSFFFFSVFVADLYIVLPLLHTLLLNLNRTVADCITYYEVFMMLSLLVGVC